MIVVAGPPGSGKSSRFPASGFGVDWFNADDRAAELNSGSFRKISNEIRAKVNLEFHHWILDHIASNKSLALETTLRSPITFDQAVWLTITGSGLRCTSCWRAACKRASVGLLNARIAAGTRLQSALSARSTAKARITFLQLSTSAKVGSKLYACTTTPRSALSRGKC